MAHERGPVGVATGTGAPTSAAGGLQGVGLSPTDLIALTALRRRVESGLVAEGATATQRLTFARWLVDHNHIQG